MRILSIDAGGTELKYGIVDENYNLSECNFIETPKDNVEDIVNAIYNVFIGFKDIDAIVLSLPGFVDVYSGMHRGGGCFHSLYNVNIKQLVENKCGVNCLVDNDGKSATIAEYYLGNLKDTKDSAVFIIGTGVGGGLIINEKLVRGRNYTAGEFSYLNVDINDDDIHSSTLADYCSTRNLLQIYEDSSENNEKISGREFFNRYHNGDEIAIEILDEFCEYIAKEIMNLGILLNIEKVAIGGGISAQDVLIEKIIDSINSLELNEFFKDVGYNPFIPEVVRCKFKNDANLLGVAYEYINSKELL